MDNFLIYRDILIERSLNMRITERRLRRVIRQVIKETHKWEETSWDKIPIKSVIEYLNKEKVPIEKYATEDVCSKVAKDLDLDDERVELANLDFPIIIVKKNNKLQYVLDGNHRLEKAKRDKNKYIKARILDLDGSNIPKQFIETL